MNRRKKIKQILKKKAKRVEARNKTNKKPPYISKADREKLMQNENQDS